VTLVQLASPRADFSTNHNIRISIVFHTGKSDDAGPVQTFQNFLMQSTINIWITFYKNTDLRAVLVDMHNVCAFACLCHFPAAMSAPTKLAFSSIKFTSV